MDLTPGEQDGVSVRSHTSWLSTSSAVLSLLVSLGFSLWGVFILGWDWREMIVFYWLTNVTIGVCTLISILRSNPSLAATLESAEGSATPAATSTSISSLSSVPAAAIKIIGGLFFSLHYGTFTVVHGIFVFSLASGSFMLAGPAPSSPLNIVQLIYGWSAIFVFSVLASLARPVHERNIITLMTNPYKRIITLHFTVIICVMLIVMFDLPNISAVLLIGFNTLFELIWLKQERRATATPTFVSTLRPRDGLVSGMDELSSNADS